MSGGEISKIGLSLEDQMPPSRRTLTLSVIKRHSTHELEGLFQDVSSIS